MILSNHTIYPKRGQRVGDLAILVLITLSLTLPPSGAPASQLTHPIHALHLDFWHVLVSFLIELLKVLWGPACVAQWLSIGL